MKLPEPAKRVIENLSKLPSIGPRQATRLMFYLVAKDSPALGSLTKNLEELKALKLCTRCYFIHENQNGLCEICANPARDPRVTMIVEKETDLMSVENTGKYKGRYLVLGAIPRTGLLDETQKARLAKFKEFIRHDLEGTAEEIILGFNPTATGDFNASLIAKELAPLAKKISRLGRGLPTGGDIEFADEETLGSALDGRI